MLLQVICTLSQSNDWVMKYVFIFQQQTSGSYQPFVETFLQAVQLMVLYVMAHVC